MNKKTVKDFFDNLAKDWDTFVKPDSAVIEKILDYADIRNGCSVLDVACGTGILFPYYLKRNPLSVTAVDLSEKMCAAAQKKCTDKRIKIICADILDINTAVGKAERCLVFNAFPHFGNAKNAVQALCRRLVPGGILTVAHSESRESINKRHKERAFSVSEPLPPAADLADIFSKHTEIIHAFENESLYIVSGRI